MQGGVTYLAVDQIQATLAEPLLVWLRLGRMVEGTQARHQVGGILHTEKSGKMVSSDILNSMLLTGS